MKRLVRATLEMAAATVGVREEGNNRGREVTEYLRVAGVAPGNPWCMAWVYAMIQRAADAGDVRNPVVKTAYCPHLANWAAEERILERSPAVADIFLAYGRVGRIFRARHVGFVVGLSGDSTFQTIEGNSNMNGSREGIGVFRLTRRMGNQYRFVRWAKVVDEEDEERIVPLVHKGKVIAEMPLTNGRSWMPVRRWAEFMGFEAVWSQEEQAVGFRVKGRVHEVPVQIALRGDTAYAPLRELAAFSGLKAVYNPTERVVTLVKAEQEG